MKFDIDVKIKLQRAPDGEKAAKLPSGDELKILHLKLLTKMVEKKIALEKQIAKLSEMDERTFLRIYLAVGGYKEIESSWIEKVMRQDERVKEEATCRE